MKKYKKLVELDGNIVKLQYEEDKRGSIDECRLTFYGHHGATHFSWYDKPEAATELGKLITELTKLKEKVQ